MKKAMAWSTPLIIQESKAPPTSIVPQPISSVGPGDEVVNTLLPQYERYLPILVAGPILRSASKKRVYVWIATSVPINVTGAILEPQLGLSDPPANWKVLGSGKSVSIMLGQRLFVHRVLITPYDKKNGFPLDTILGYELTFFVPKDVGFAFTDENGLIKRDAIAYGNASLPTFTLGRDPAKPGFAFNVLHASCRKLHGPGDDATVEMDRHLKSVHDYFEDRPSALLLTGDQVYADDVSSGLTLGIEYAAAMLMGYQERLPDGKYLSDIDGARGTTVTKEEHGFTVDKSVGGNHVMSFGEFAALYIFSWSTSLWDHPDLEPYITLSIRESVEATQRVFANVPCYMIMDDHEITDDWPCTQEMYDTVMKSSLTRWIVANGMMACWAFQLWGNANGKGGSSEPPFYLPFIVYTMTECYDSVDTTAVDEARKQYVRAVLRVTGYSFVTPTVPPVLFMDTRTQRSFDGNDAPGLMSGKGLSLLQTKLGEMSLAKGMPLLIVSPPPAIGFTLVEEALGWLGRRGTVFNRERPWYYVDPEAWSYEPRTYFEMLKKVNTKAHSMGSPIVFFSGDVHYGFFASGAFIDGTQGSLVFQLTSSALRNRPETPKARALTEAQILGSSTHELDFWEVMPFLVAVAKKDDDAPKIGEIKPTKLGSLNFTFQDAGTGKWNLDSLSIRPVPIPSLSILPAPVPVTANTLIQANNFGIVRIEWGAQHTVEQELRPVGGGGRKVKNLY